MYLQMPTDKDIELGKLQNRLANQTGKETAEN